MKSIKQSSGRRNRWRRAILSTTAAASVALVLGQTGIAAAGVSTDAADVVVNFSGSVQEVAVPTGVGEATIHAVGGSGGWANGSGNEPGLGGQVDSTLKVHPGEKLEISVGGAGHGANRHASPAAGGWGGLFGTGGDGRADGSDYLRNSGGGGGATTLQILNPDGTETTVLVVGGGGGSGGNAGGGAGGSAGGTPQDENGQEGTGVHAGSGGLGGVSAWTVGGRGGDAGGKGGYGGGGGGGQAGGYGGNGGANIAGGGGRRRGVDLGRFNPAGRLGADRFVRFRVPIRGQRHRHADLASLIDLAAHLSADRRATSYPHPWALLQRMPASDEGVLRRPLVTCCCWHRRRGLRPSAGEFDRAVSGLRHSPCIRLGHPRNRLTTA